MKATRTTVYIMVALWKVKINNYNALTDNFVLSKHRIGWSAIFAKPSILIVYQVPGSWAAILLEHYSIDMYNYTNSVSHFIQVLFHYLLCCCYFLILMATFRVLITDYPNVI